MKALTLHQPWATFIALGVKPHETRSWPAPESLIGERIAIHAGLRRPGHLGHIPALQSKWDGKTRDELDAHNAGTWLVLDTITDPAFKGLQPQGKRFPKRALTPTLFFPHSGPHARRNPNKPEFALTIYLPLGAVVATAVLANCVPTETVEPNPYGDYTPGRWAWILDRIEVPPEPMPAKGKQGLWEWTWTAVP